MSDGRSASLLGALLLTVYAAGACPTIYMGDSGEFPLCALLAAGLLVLGSSSP